MRCSVVIPTYNRCESLMRTLDALALQSIPKSDFEVIVVSDGSTDSTQQSLLSYAESGKLNLRVFSQTNSGPAAARNRGVSEAKTELIVFTDDDVEPVPAFLERHLSHHDAPNAIVLGPLSPNPKWTNSEPVWIAWEHRQLQNIYNLFKPGGEFEGPYAGFEHFYSGNASLRKHWLDAAGGFDTKLKRQEDTELAARIKTLGDVKFIWDFDADGLHHPVRTLKSWLNIPASYGKVDAGRVQAGTLSQSYIDSNNAKRHTLTKALDKLCETVPVLITPISRLLVWLGIGAYKLGAKSPAIAALSAAYNILYMTAYRQTISQTAIVGQKAQVS